MASRLIELEDGTLVEVEVPENEARPIAGGAAEKIKDATIDKIKPIILKACKPISEIWKELDQDMHIEQAEVELGLGFEAEGNLYITKGSMRKTEILSIRKEHVDLQHRIIFIPKAKAGAREQPITQEVADFLLMYMETLPEDTPWLFPSMTSACGHAVRIREAFQRAVVAAGLNPDEIVPHTLRHTVITHLVQDGVDLPTVQRISGHKTLAMVAKYAHQNGAHIQAAMDKLETRYRTKTE